MDFDGCENVASGRSGCHVLAYSVGRVLPELAFGADSPPARPGNQSGRGACIVCDHYAGRWPAADRPGIEESVTVGQWRQAAPVDLGDLFRRHHAELVRLAVLIVRDQPTAEDVVQDVFARLQARPGEPGRPGEELSYIRVSVLNGCRSVLRRRAVVGRVQMVRAGSDVAASAESEVLLAEDRRQVLAALAALPVRRREVLVLRFWLGLSEAEIAATLGISQGSVKSAAARGLAALAKALGEES